MSITEKRQKQIVFNNNGFDISFESEHWVGKAKYLKITCTTCRTTYNRSVSTLAILKNKTICDYCLRLKQWESLNNKGFDFLGSESGNYYIACKVCCKVLIRSYAVCISTDTICEHCTERKITDILYENNCSLINIYSKNTIRRVVYINADGVQNDVQLRAIMSNSFSKRHKENNPYKVYMFWNILEKSELINDGLYFKIGIAIDPQNRLNILKLDFPCNIKILEECKDRKSALKKEQELHRIFHWCRLNKIIAEIFTNRRSCVRIKSTNRRHYMKDGATEWFHLPEDLFHLLLRSAVGLKEDAKNFSKNNNMILGVVHD